jgi:expansin (peptidoglycan-binding protein)
VWAVLERRRPIRLGRGGWWATAASAAAVALAVALSLQLFTQRSCAATLDTATLDTATPDTATLSTAGNGRATFYDASGAGNCSYPRAPADGLFVALSPGEYAAGALCGGYLEVTGPRGTVRVLITDQCPECERGHLDLGRTAFSRIGDPGQGIIPVTYRLLRDPPTPGPLTVRVKEGSSRYWLALLVGDTGNPLAGVEVRVDGSWQPLQRADYNYWIAARGAGTGPLTVRVADVQGHRTTLEGVSLTPGATQLTDARLYGTGSGPGTAAGPLPRAKGAAATRQRAVTARPVPPTANPAPPTAPATPVVAAAPAAPQLPAVTASVSTGEPATGSSAALGSAGSTLVTSPC